MKLKKLLACFMAACMVMTAVPVMAEDTPVDNVCTDENCETPHVAAIGQKEYHSIQDAVDAADDGDTIKVIADIEETPESDSWGTLDGKYDTYVKVEGKKVTIDLNGKTIKVYHKNGERLLVGLFSTDNNGHLTLIDSDSEGEGKVEVVDNSDMSYVYAMVACYEPGCTVTIESGNYKMVEMKSEKGVGLIFSAVGENLTINGGTFSVMNIATLANDSPWIFNSNGDGIKVNNGTFNFDINHQYYVNEVYVAKEKAVKKNDTATWWTINDAVAYVNEQETIKGSSGWKVHEVGYATLEEAINTANVYDHKTYTEEDKYKDHIKNAPESITLLKDCVLSSNIGEPVKIGETVIPLTINGEGKTITVDKDIKISQTITVKGDLTLNAHGHTVTSAVKDGESNPVAPFSMGEGAELTIIGGTFNFDPTDYLPEKGCAVEENEGLYKIVPVAGSKAIIGSVGYEIVEDALAAAKPGDTIEVLVAVEEETKIYKDVVSADLSEGAKLELDEDVVTITGASAATVGDATVEVPDGASIKVDRTDGKVTLPEAEGSGIEIDGKVISAGSGEVTITPDGEVTLPEDSEITIGDKKITVGEGNATITKDGDVELPKDSTIQNGDTEIKVGEGGATVTDDGKVELSYGGVISKEGKETITVDDGKVTVDPATGTVTAPEGSEIKVGDKKITVGEGEAVIDAEGNVTLPEGSEIKVGDKEITVGKGEATIGGDGTVTLPEGSEIVIEDENGNKTEITVGDGEENEEGTPDDTATIKPNGEVTVPEGSTIVTGDKEITVGDSTDEDTEGPATIKPNGDVIVPEGSQIVVDGDGDGTADKTITVGEGGNATIESDGDVNLPAGSKIKEGEKVTELEGGGIVNQNGTVSMPDTTVKGTQVYAPKGGHVTVNGDDSVTVPTDGKVVINGETIEVTEGSVTVKPDGTVTVPAGSTIKKGDTEIKAGAGGLTVDNDGKVTVPENGTVKINGTTVTLPEGGTVDANGAITADKVVIGDATVTPPAEGGKVTVEGDDKVTIPEGSKIEIGDETITVNKGEVTIDQDGNTVTVPEGSEVKVGDVTVNKGEVTVEPADNNAAEPEEDKVTISAGSEIEVDGKDITVGEGGATIESGESGSTVTLPEGSQIEIGEDTKITVGEGGTTITPEEEVILPEGSEIEIGEGTKITVGDGEGNDDTATITPEGEVTLPDGSKIETGEDTEITVGEGGATLDPDSGDITLSEGSKIEVGGNEIIVGDGEGEDDTVKIDSENGTVIIPEGSTITQGNGTVIESVDGDLTLDDDGNVVIPEGGTVNVDGRPTVFPNGGGIDTDGTVNITPNTSNSGNKSSKKYDVSVDTKNIKNGSVKLSPSKAKKGATVTLTVTPDAGYELEKLVVLDKDGNKVELTDKGDGKFTFKMPRGGVEVDAEFVEADAAGKSEIVLTIGSNIVMVDGEPVVNDVAPIIRGERTFLPIRLIAEALGATVAWNEADQSVAIVKDGLEIVIYIGQAFALVNGDPVALDEAAFIENSRTYLPLRFIVENLGAAVTWDGVSKTVTVVG